MIIACGRHIPIEVCTTNTASSWADARRGEMTLVYVLVVCAHIPFERLYCGLELPVISNYQTKEECISAANKIEEAGNNPASVDLRANCFPVVLKLP